MSSDRPVLSRPVAEFLFREGVGGSASERATEATQLDRIEALLKSINDGLQDTVRAIERQTDTLGRTADRLNQSVQSLARGAR